MPRPTTRPVAPLICLLLAVSGFLLLDGAAPAEAAQASASQPAGERPTAPGLTLDEWRSLKKMTAEIFKLPEGPERMARCEAFLKEHPEYPDPVGVLNLLVSDYLGTSGFDPSRAIELLEKLAAARGDTDATLGLFVVEEHYLPLHLSPASAQRILARCRRALEAGRRRLAKQGESPSPYQWSLAAVEFQLLLDEGRVLLELGQVDAALKKLQEAEARRKEQGNLVSIQDAKGTAIKYLPSRAADLSWLYLSMAEAYARLGERSAATERLGWVRGSGDPQELFDARVEKLRSDLKLPPAEDGEVRGEAIPASDFALEDLGGNTVRLSDYAGKTVLLLLWATW